MFVFAVLVLIVFNFAIGANPELIRQVAPGVLWVALLFATILGLQRSVELEREEDCLQCVLLAMGDRSALFVAKTIANLIYLLAVAVCTLPLFSIWFRLDILSRVAPLSMVLLLGMLGFSVIGTLFSPSTGVVCAILLPRNQRPGRPKSQTPHQRHPSASDNQ